MQSCLTQSIRYTRDEELSQQQIKFSNVNN